MNTYAIRREQAWRSPDEVRQASDPEAIRRHLQRVGMPADENLAVVDTVIIKPDPVQEPVAS